MALTIELDASEERVLETAAAARGVSLAVYLREIVKNAAQTNEIARREAVRTTRGKYAHVALTPELRRQMKDDELRREANL